MPDLRAALTGPQYDSIVEASQLDSRSIASWVRFYVVSFARRQVEAKRRQVEDKVGIVRDIQPNVKET